MRYMFYDSSFSQDLTNWKPYNLRCIDYIFRDYLAQAPYWSSYQQQHERNYEIKTYHERLALEQQLNENLHEHINNHKVEKKHKI
jgi:hypothetical protein